MISSIEDCWLGKSKLFERLSVILIFEADSFLDMILAVCPVEGPIALLNLLDWWDTDYITTGWLELPPGILPIY